MNKQQPNSIEECFQRIESWFLKGHHKWDFIELVISEDKEKLIANIHDATVKGKMVEVGALNLEALIWKMAREVS